MLDFVWKYVLNIHGRILYSLWFFKKRNFIEIKNNDKLLIKDNELFNDLSKKILKGVNEHIISNAKKKILNANQDETNITNSKDNKFSINIFKNLDENTKEEIFKFATSDYIISTAAKYLGIYPILANISLNYNIPRKKDNVRGSMLGTKTI